MGLLDEISAYLHTAGVGTLATDIFLGSIPDSPDNCIVLIESGGSPPDRTFGGGNADNEDVRLQVITRNLDYSAGRVKIANVVTALDGIIETTISSVLYHGIFVVTPASFLSRDANLRFIISVTFEVRKAPS